jgi:glycine/D-amino acid oxidase-like deaminating enzyme
MKTEASKIIVVGAGIVNLMTALYLQWEGWDVAIFDKMNDPFSNGDWQKKGATFGGSNARMFSFTEADNYNEKSSKIYSNMLNVFQNDIHHEGWRVIDEIGKNESEWIRRFQSVSAINAHIYSNEIYSFNKESGNLWNKLIQKEQHLFDGTNLREGIIRLYSEREDYMASVSLHKTLHSFLYELDRGQIQREYPFLKDSIDKDMFGGAMMVKGFTLQIHDLCRNLIGHLKRNNVEFFWNQELETIEKNNNGEIAGLRIQGSLYTAKHYVLSLGAYCGGIYDNMSSRNIIHGVLGVWMALPNPYGLEHSMKIHKKGRIGEDTNVTVVEENNVKNIILGSGYGYVGNIASNNAELTQLSPIYDSLKNTAATYFPEAYDIASDNGAILKDLKYCVRPFTPDGLGVFEVAKNKNSGYTIITGGHNTGGFTLSPIVASSVAQTLNGSLPEMHYNFHPKRNWN